VEQGQSANVELQFAASGVADELVHLQCANVPRNSTCTVTPAALPLDRNVRNVRMTLQTTAPRSARLSKNLGTPAGNHRLQVIARVGSAVKTVDVDIAVVPRPLR